MEEVEEAQGQDYNLAEQLQAMHDREDEIDSMNHYLYREPEPGFVSTFQLEAEFKANGTIPVRKYRSEKTSMSIYFADLDTQVISGYFCFGTDALEALGLEEVINGLDSSADGLFPRFMRCDLLSPIRKFHGCHHPLADRDQSVYICDGFGETEFRGAFVIGTYILRNLDLILDAHGYRCPNGDMPDDHEFGGGATQGPSSNVVVPGDGDGGGERPTEGARVMADGIEDVGDEREPSVKDQECYYLSESKEGSMGWEVNLQAMFPGTRAFWNRLFEWEMKSLHARMRSSHDRYYRPENLAVIITGRVTCQNRIFEILQDYEEHYVKTHPHSPPFVRPWTQLPLPRPTGGSTILVPFLPKDPERDPRTTICFGWRGCPTKDFETTMALKVLTYYIASRPLWNKFVYNGISCRVSWRQVEYADCCSLITVDGIKNDPDADQVVEETKEILKGLREPGALSFCEIQNMTVRAGACTALEFEHDPALFLASNLAKCERYGQGEGENYTSKRLSPQRVFDELGQMPIEYWTNLIHTYFCEDNTFVSILRPRDYKKKKSGPGEASCSNSKMESDSWTKQGLSRDQSVTSNSELEGINNANKIIADIVAKMREVKVEEEDGGAGTPSDSGDAESDASSDEYYDYDEYPLSEGFIKKCLETEVFPLGHHPEEAEDMNVLSLRMPRLYLQNFLAHDPKYISIKTYKSDGSRQHPAFPVYQMPIYTFLDDLNTSFVHMTLAIDTTGLRDDQRKVLGALISGLEGFLAPRPLTIDTHSVIEFPNEFNPSLHLIDSGVTYGLIGHFLQSIFIKIVVLPKNYEWAIGMFEYLLNKMELTSSFLRFICEETAEALGGTYYKSRQTPDPEGPDYTCFTARGINRHSLVHLMYKKESNARLCVGRRRLDLLLEVLETLGKEEGQGNGGDMVRLINETWKSLVSGPNMILQVGANVTKLAKVCAGGDLSRPWRTRFSRFQRQLVFTECSPTLETDLARMETLGSGIVVTVDYPRMPCLSMALPIIIDFKHEDYPALSLAVELFSLAQKWIWQTMDIQGLEGYSSGRVMRITNSFSNIIELIIESPDVLGSFLVLKHIVREDWEWLSPMMTLAKESIARKQGTMELGPAEAYNNAMLAHLTGRTVDKRRSFLTDTLKVTFEDIQRIIRNYVIHLFDPTKCWTALMVHETNKEKLTELLGQLGFNNLMDMDLTELCTTL